MSSKRSIIFLLLAFWSLSLQEPRTIRSGITLSSSEPAPGRAAAHVPQSPAPAQAGATGVQTETGRALRRYQGEILVSLAPGSDPRILAQQFAWIEGITKIAESVYLIRFDEGQQGLAQVEAELATRREVSATEANYALMMAAGTVSVPAAEAPPTGFGRDASGEVPPQDHDVCIIDSALVKDLPGIGQQADFSQGQHEAHEADRSAHGTLVYGIVAGLTRSTPVQIRQPNICLAAIFEADGYARLSALVQGLHWAAERSSLINLSLGFYHDSPLLRRTLEELQQKGIWIVAAAGNDATQATLFPAAYPAVIAVGSHNRLFQRSAFSNWSETVDYVLPGEELESWKRSEVVQRLTGTSAATALFTWTVVQGLLRGHTLEKIQESIDRHTVEQMQEPMLQPRSFQRFDPDAVVGDWDGQSPRAIVVTRFETQGEFFSGHSLRLHLSWQDALSSPRLPFRLLLRNSRGEIQEIQTDPEQIERRGTSHTLQKELRIDRNFLAEEGAEELTILLEQTSRMIQGPRQRQIWRDIETRQSVKLKQIWVTPLDFVTEDVQHTLTVVLHNRRALAQDELMLKVFAIPAVHEGLARTPRQYLGSFPVPTALAGYEGRTMTVDIPRATMLDGKLSFYVELYQQENFVDSLFKSYRQKGPYQALPLYAQKVHRAMIEEAIRLLERQGIRIADLNDPLLRGIHRGSVADQNEWPTIGFGDFSLPTGAIETTDFWDDAVISQLKAFFGVRNLSIIDGAHDADAIDIAFGYTFEDVFDSHFWIVDQHDDDGLDSSGQNHHSALTKMRALLYGGGQLRHGAIAHYRQGHRVAAWWFLGHAAHLLGDLTVPSHVNNENAHGTYGDAYHDWMDDGAFQRWTADHPLIAGPGFVDPYSPKNQGDPVRYLAYTAAQLGNSYAWASTLVGTTFGKSGNRTLGGDRPHYEEAMQDLFAPLPHRPLLEWHINKDEVKDVFGDCDLVDWIGPTERSADCKDRDGHKDRDNTDRHGNDDDGDLTRIANSNYTYGIRAIAGLIYFFAKETGQIP